MRSKYCWTTVCQSTERWVISAHKRTDLVEPDPLKLGQFKKRLRTPCSGLRHASLMNLFSGGRKIDNEQKRFTTVSVHCWILAEPRKTGSKFNGDGVPS
jgi:hypothetical protein